MYMHQGEMDRRKRSTLVFEPEGMSRVHGRMCLTCDFPHKRGEMCIS